MLQLLSGAGTAFPHLIQDKMGERTAMLASRPHPISRMISMARSKSASAYISAVTP